MALSQVETTAGRVRKQLYLKHYDVYRKYFADFLGDNPTAINKVEALVDSRYIKGLYAIISTKFTTAEMATLSPEESRAIREAALQDVLVEIKVKQGLQELEKRAMKIARKEVA
jgi:hypothetical protein